MRGSCRARLICSGFVKTPILLGLLRPVVVIPPVPYVQNGMVDNLRDILRHELTHYKRRDLLYKWFAMLAACLHWFNPLVYLVRREIGRACELSCDEAVISALTPNQKQHYGETLMSLAAKEASPPGILATTMCEEKARLKERLVAIMTHKATTRAAALLSALLLLIVAGCAAVNSVGETAEPAATPSSAAPDLNPASPVADKVTLFEKYGLTVAIPNEYIDKLIVVTEPEWEYQEGTTLISVYEKRSYEECRAEYGEDAYAGFIFSIARYTRARYEAFLASDGSGQSFFARDDTYYYGWFTATDVQFYRSGGEINIESEDWKEWEALYKRCAEIKADFIARNHLTPYSDSEFWDKEFTWEGPHLFLTYYPYYAYQDTATAQGFSWDAVPYTLILSQPATQGETGIWCVERWYDNNGSIYYEFPYESGKAAMDYYVGLQEAADSGGGATLCDPVKAALAFARNRLGHDAATEDSFRRIDGEVAGNVWRLCRQVFDDIGTLKAATFDETGNSVDREALPVPEELTPFGSYASSSLYPYIWLKAEAPAKNTGGAVYFRSSDGNKTIAFYQQDSLLCINVDGITRWYRPAYPYHWTPYDGMLGLYKQFTQYNKTKSMSPQPSLQAAADASNNIEDLPKELYIARNSDGNSHFYAHWLQYSFDIEEATNFTITIELARGNIKLSIKNIDTDKTIFESQDTNSINDTITLEKGTYGVIISGSLYNGSVHILSNQTEAALRD